MTPVRQKALAALRDGRVTVLLADRAVLAPPDVEPPARITAVVQSSRDDRRTPYFVDLQFGVWTCTCASAANGAHIAAVAMVTGHPSAAAKGVSV